MLSQFVFTAVQTRILLALLFEGTLCSSAILRRVGISGTSWAKEKQTLLSLDLISCNTRRELTAKGIARKTEVCLTKKGRFVSQNLMVISELSLTQAIR